MARYKAQAWPIIMPQVEATASSHWHEEVRTYMKSLLEKFKELDEAAYMAAL